jgi:hypothetical protein
VTHPKAIGDRSTLAIMLALQDAGYAILVPFGENTRYDLVIDDGERLARVQCKTGRLSNGAVRFPMCSTYAHHPNPRTPNRHYLGQVDYFAVYCLQAAAVYLIPISDIPLRRQAALRIEPPRNNQKLHIRYAEPYLVRSVRLAPSRAPGGAAGAEAPSA